MRYGRRSGTAPTRFRITSLNRHSGGAPAGGGTFRGNSGEQPIIIGVAPAGAEIATRPFQLVTGRVEGNGIRRRARRTDVPKIVDWYMEGKIEIDPMITHTMPLADINKGFDLMHEGKSIRSVVVY
jgi:Zn-dependent alcohol dehydrogenase